MKKIFTLHSIRIKIFFYILGFMVLPLIVITIISNFVSEENLLEQIQEKDIATMEHVETMINTLTNSIENYGLLIGQDETLRSALKLANHQTQVEDLSPELCAIVQNKLNAYLKNTSNLIGLSLIDKSGHFVGESNLNLNRLQWFFNQSIIASFPDNHSFWSEAFTIEFNETENKKRVFSCAVPILNQSSELLGYILLYMEESTLNQFVYPLSSDFYVLDNYSYVIANKKFYQNENHIMQQYFFSVSNISFPLLEENNSIIVKTQNPPVIVTTKKYPPMNWQFVIISPFSEISSAILSRVSTVTIVCIGCIVFAIISALFISNLFTKPIIQLKNTMLLVSDGDFDSRYKITTNDEIAELGETFNSLIDTINSLISQIYTQQQNKQKLQLQLLNAQIKPHFLYNVLEMINSFIRDGMAHEATDSVHNLSQFYRIFLNDGSDLITIDKELELIKSYLSLQRLRYIEYFDYTLFHDPSLNNYKIPKLSLQPLLENAIYHGVKNRFTKGIIRVNGYLKKERIYFQIYDNGQGIDDEIKQQIYKSLKDQEISKHFGISSVIHRLNIYFDNQVTLNIDSEKGEYTQITLSFPIQPNDKV